jgi:glycosyltransferase involved in cell wall biosynthesis
MTSNPLPQNVLYLSYDGALDPLGRSQVVPYLEGLSRAGYRFDLISFEKPQRFSQVEDQTRMQARLSAAQITWHPLPYHRHPSALATSYDLARGLWLARRLARVRRFALVHARSYPASLIAWRLGLPYVFDMRGLYAEERVEGGIWPAGGALHRMTKALEPRLLRDAAAVITLTEASVSVLRKMMASAGSRAVLEVIPTGVDLDRFRTLARPEGPFTAAYLGSLGTWYLLEEMLLLGRALLACAPEAKLLFLSNDDPAPLRARAAAQGLPTERFLSRSVPHEQVPEALHEAWATFALIQPSPSKIASAATKFGESLALGLPALINRGIGDSAEVALSERVGVVVEELSPPGYARAAEEIFHLSSEEGIRERCRRTAEARFDLARGVTRYAALYEAVSGRAGRP